MFNGLSGKGKVLEIYLEGVSTGSKGINGGCLGFSEAFQRHYSGLRETFPEHYRVVTGALQRHYRDF